MILIILISKSAHQQKVWLLLLPGADCNWVESHRPVIYICAPIIIKSIFGILPLNIPCILGHLSHQYHAIINTSNDGQKKVARESENFLEMWTPLMIHLNVWPMWKCDPCEWGLAWAKTAVVYIWGGHIYMGAEKGVGHHVSVPYHWVSTPPAHNAMCVFPLYSVLCCTNIFSNSRRTMPHTVSVFLSTVASTDMIPTRPCCVSLAGAQCRTQFLSIIFSRLSVMLAGITLWRNGQMLQRRAAVVTL